MNDSLMKCVCMHINIETSEVRGFQQSQQPLNRLVNEVVTSLEPLTKYLSQFQRNLDIFEYYSIETPMIVNHQNCHFEGSYN